MNSAKTRVDVAPEPEPEVVADVMGYFDKGAEVLFSRSHTGDAKIKVKYGPFKLLKVRYTVSDKVALAIKEAIRTRSKKV